MAKKKDPFEDFAEKMLSGPRVSEISPVADNDASQVQESAAPSPASDSQALPSPAEEVEKKGLRADHKAFTVYIKNDLLQKIRTAHYKSNMTAKAIINQALEEYFDKHKGLL